MSSAHSHQPFQKKPSSERGDQDDREDPADPFAEQGIQHVPAVQLTGRDEVQEGDQQSRPACPGNRVQQHILPADRDGMGSEEIADPVQRERHIIPHWRGQQFTLGDVFQSNIKQGIAFQQVVVRAGVTIAGLGCVGAHIPHAGDLFVIGILSGIHRGEHQAEDQHRDGNHQPGQRTGNAEVEQGALILGELDFNWMKAPMVPSMLTGRG